MLSKDDLWHNLPLSPTIFFVLRNPISRESFGELLAVLKRIGGPSEKAVSDELFWAAVIERSHGTRRWDSLVPRYKGSTEGEGLLAFQASKNSVENIPKCRRRLSAGPFRR